MPTLPTYVLITPARDEAQLIELTIKSVVAQTVRPLKWVIVSDGSTDGTDDIVREYAAQHPWIELVRTPERRERHFAGKVYAFNAGYARVKDLKYQVIGNLDADVSFEADHFEFLVAKFADDPQLGVVGAPFREGGYQYDYRFANIENVWGGCQLFRRECFEGIGGYVPVKAGAIDHIAVVSARMKGWKTRTFTEKVCLHRRPIGTAQHGKLGAKFGSGAKDYLVGNHPIWELLRIFYQMKQPPFLLGGLAIGVGYAWSAMRGANRPISEDQLAFTQSEQMQRLNQFLLGKARREASAAPVVPTMMSGKLNLTALALPTYVLITPARDEAQFIELTLKSVAAQTVRPLKWVIVSDGSTDGTDDIVREYAAQHPWIELVRMPERRERHFAGKVHAFNAGYARVKDLKYEAIGSLDADISFDQDYFSSLVRKLAEDPSLGVVGTPFKDSSVTYNYRLVGIEHVSGACQLFRRQCFEEIGGYLPVKGGGVDFIAVTSARMKGWKTRTYTDKVCLHNRPMGKAQGGTWVMRFRMGVKDYSLGSHPLWECLRTVYQMGRKPYVVGGLVLGAGYLWALVRHVGGPIPPQMVTFRRREQMQRLWGLLRKSPLDVATQ
jgi:cellulose synthase/poly-beta-1,6-N-acetylglucosamine synthase-like glycosyltransferase